MNIENENNQDPQELDDEQVAQEILAEFGKITGNDDDVAEPETPAEPEVQEPAHEDTETPDDTPSEPSDEPDDSVADDHGDDDSILGDGSDEEAGPDEDAFRKDFATRYGLDEADIAGMGVEQLENFGRAMDRKTLNELRPQQAPPQQPQMPQQHFQQPTHFNFPQQQMPPQQPQFQQPQQLPDLNELRRMAEDEGYDPKFIDAIQSAQQYNQQLTQQLQQREWERQQQEQQRNQQIINEFDSALDSLKVTSVFGENRDAAQQNQMHWQARANLFDSAVQFSQNTGQPLNADLVKRVASVLYPDQLQNSQQSNIASKARKQHNNKLGSGQLNRNKKKPAPKNQSDFDGLDPEVPRLLEDPEIASIFSAANDG